eukprot:scaffold18772_cov112-Isochrysis_galbana.AAC.2
MVAIKSKTLVVIGMMSTRHSPSARDRGVSNSDTVPSSLRFGREGRARCRAERVRCASETCASEP